MIHPPVNPHAAAARAAIMAYHDGSAEYRLTWPGDQPGVCCIAGQWRRNEAGEIEAWYSAAQLREILEVIKSANPQGGNNGCN